MAIEQLYGNFDASYNELQGWIAAMREYVPGTVIELQTRPYYGPDEQLQPEENVPPLGVPVCHGDPFTAYGTSQLTSIEIIRMQNERDKL
ncbi:hypothetical protein J1N35_045414 [Gossypium stocksii]|uniref:Uncharacterized protein n=1 Tax=Gossypium stocksii TaxID=47602 RepID=A0A9D3UB72_9ROSI|nr:hypothetical protein J1N35_045414 [Gossypium stocksii]